jgi:hypothetical protein
MWMYIFTNEFASFSKQDLNFNNHYISFDVQQNSGYGYVKKTGNGIVKKCSNFL